MWPLFLQFSPNAFLSIHLVTYWIRNCLWSTIFNGEKPKETDILIFTAILWVFGMACHTFSRYFSRSSSSSETAGASLRPAIWGVPYPAWCGRGGHPWVSRQAWSIWAHPHGDGHVQQLLHRCQGQNSWAPSQMSCCLSRQFYSYLRKGERKPASHLPLFSPKDFSPTDFSPIYFSPTDFSPRVFHPYTSHPYTFYPETLHPETRLARTFHPETFHP